MFRLWNIENNRAPFFLYITVIAELKSNLDAIKEELELDACRQKEAKAFQNDMALDLAVILLNLLGC